MIINNTINKSHNPKGITLVITIIILLILSAITINAIAGREGTFNSTKSVTKTEVVPEGSITIVEDYAVII